MPGQAGGQDREGHHDLADEDRGGRDRHRGVDRQSGQGGGEVRLRQDGPMRERREEDSGKYRGLRCSEDYNALRAITSRLWKLYFRYLIDVLIIK